MKPLLLFLTALLFLSPTSVPAQQTRNHPSFFFADSGQFLPDTAVLARVNDRVIRVIDFRSHYFTTYVFDRPTPDSAGRAEFLNNMVNGEVMGLTALAINHPLTFEDRVTLRDHTQTVLENVLHKRLVSDSVRVTEADVRAVYPQYAYEQHLRRILVDDRKTAEAVRRELLAGRIGWNEAVRRYSHDPSLGSDGDMGWVKRASVHGQLALEAFRLQPGATSHVVQDLDGFMVLQCVARRPVDPPGYVGVRRSIANDIRSARSAPLVAKLFDMARTAAGVVYDTTNIAWAAGKFQTTFLANAAATGKPLAVAPVIDPADTGRVLARTRDSRFTLRQFLDGYTSIKLLLRGRITSFESLRFTLDGLLLGPQMASLARERGLDKDPFAVEAIAKRREALLIDHLYQDSILSHVSVTPQMRKEYYDKHRSEYVSIPVAHYARFVRSSAASADSLVALLRAGASAESLIAADSARGVRNEAIETVRGNDQHSGYRSIMFEELRPGQVSRIDPGRSETSYGVVKLLERDESRPMAFKEVERIVDESLQNIESERLLKAFLARHRPEYHIEVHPERVMGIRLVDPDLDVKLD